MTPSEKPPEEERSAAENAKTCELGPFGSCLKHLSGNMKDGVCEVARLRSALATVTQERDDARSEAERLQRVEQFVRKAASDLTSGKMAWQPEGGGMTFPILKPKEQGFLIAVGKYLLDGLSSATASKPPTTATTEKKEGDRT